ncbi:MAG: 30S ribosomal protein S6 [Candidatus Dojkabacteria bacterium]
MKYELAIVVKPLSNEEIKEKVVVKIEKAVADLEGKLSKYNFLGKRLLAYPIKNNKEGFYIFAKLNMSPKQVSAFDRALNLNTDVLRFLRVSEDSL